MGEGGLEIRRVFLADLDAKFTLGIAKPVYVDIAAVSLHSLQ